MATITALFILSSLMPPAQAAAQPPVSVTCEFRVFNGADEVSRETQVRVYPSGRREKGVPADSTGRVPLAPGLYDVQAIREPGGQVTGVRWVENLLIQRYPDEEGRHLEVINFKNEYGALELKTGGQADYEATAFAAGDRARSVASALPGDGYLLLVLPAGRYDVRVREKAGGRESWLPDIDVPAGRTRLRTIRPSDFAPHPGR